MTIEEAERIQLEKGKRKLGLLKRHKNRPPEQIDIQMELSLAERKKHLQRPFLQTE
jgi:hypothetical protein